MSAVLLAALPLVPALAGGALLLRAPGAGRFAGGAAVLAAAIAAALSVFAVVEPGVAEWRWLGAGVTLGLDARGINGILALLVAATALVVKLYAVRFLGPEEARARFFGFMSLFLGAMLGLVLARDLVTLLIGWELVGLCSYALIGFWHAEAGRGQDAMRAFLVTRFADLGLYIAAMAAFAGGTLVLAALPDLAPGLRDLAMAGILLAALGKSAQLPFSGWLKGAMSGPAPVSALLHSATMVAAGAVVLVKLMPLVEAVTWAGPVILWIGVATVLVGAAIALAQDDLKQLLAASTVSQYGYMFAGLGALGAASASAHLVNHAAFKALLFLGAGVLILDGYHRLSEMQGLRRARPGLALLMAAGALSLAALPPFGGFFSKDKLLSDVLHAAPVAFGLLTLGGVLTAWYAGRAWLGAFTGTERVGAVRRPVLVATIAALAAAALAGGALLLPPLKHWWSGLFPGGGLPGFKTWELVLTAAAALLGLGLAAAGQRGWVGLGPLGPAARDWFGLPEVIDRAGRGGWQAARLLDDVAGRLPQPEAAGRSAFAAARAARGVDLRVFDWAVRGTATGSLRAAAGSKRFDGRAIDGALARLDRVLGAGAGLLARAQSGYLHHYYAGVAIGVAALIAAAALLMARYPHA